YHDVVLTADLPALPLTPASVPISFGASIASQLSYNADKKQLQLSGYMSLADLNTLKTLSTDSAYQAAITALYTSAQQTDSSAANIFFATATDIVNNLKSLSSARTADRFAVFINKISPLYLKLQQQNVLIQ